MTGREWQPGDVAMVTVGFEANRHVGWFDGSGWRYATDLWASSDPAIVTARPLVVIDPEDREQVERLVNLVDDCFTVDLAQTRLREFASPAPPKCPAAVNLAGAHFECVEPEGHGGGHRNPDAEAVWGEGA